MKFKILASILVLNFFSNSLNQEELEIISLKGDLDYFEICNLVKKNSYYNIGSAVKIKDEDTIKTIPLYSLSHGLHRWRNRLEVTKDSIHAFETGKFPLKDIKKALKKFYLDRGDDGYVVINLGPTGTSKDLEGLLVNLTQEFNKMNGETAELYDLRIYLLCIKEIKPPSRSK